MLGIATMARAQYSPDGRYGSNGAYAPDSVSALIDRTHNDLNRAYGVWNFSGHDRGRLNHAEERLRDFAEKWHRGRFDRGELDDCIGSVQHILDRNQLPYRERAALDSDVSQLRGMREAYNRHELYVR